MTLRAGRINVGSEMGLNSSIQDSGDNIHSTVNHLHSRAPRTSLWTQVTAWTSTELSRAITNKLQHHNHERLEHR
jgi:hypothetical protein